MATLPEALAALDALICNDNSCFFAPAKRGGMSTNGGCRCFDGRRDGGKPFLVPALAAVVKAARAEAEQFSERDAIVCARLNVLDALVRVRRAKTNAHGRALPKTMARRLARIESALSDLTVEMGDALSAMKEGA